MIRFRVRVCFFEEKLIGIRIEIEIEKKGFKLKKRGGGGSFWIWSFDNLLVQFSFGVSVALLCGRCQSCCVVLYFLTNSFCLSLFCSKSKLVLQNKIKFN